MDQLPRSINLLPPPTKEEEQKVELKGRVDVSSVVAIFVFVLLGLVILIINLYFKFELQKYENKKEDLITAISPQDDSTEKESTGYISRLILSKWSAYQTIIVYTTSDYQQKMVLLVDNVDTGCDVSSFDISNDKTFSFSGVCDNIDDVFEMSAKMREQNKSFDWISIDRVTSRAEINYGSESSFTTGYEFTLSGMFGDI